MKLLVSPHKILFHNANCFGYCPVDCWRFGSCQKYNGKWD